MFTGKVFGVLTALSLLIRPKLYPEKPELEKNVI
jgi:hypothetical protein